MASTETINALLGQQVDDSYALPDRVGPPNDRVLAPTQIGDGLHGPRSVVRLQIYRDPLPLAVDELAFQRSLGMEVFARNPAGRTFYLNPDMTAGGANLDAELPGMPLKTGQRPSKIVAGQGAAGHAGIPRAETLPPARTVYYTATPYVSGWDW